MINILYIAGAGRSGSTLLERILGQIDGAVAVGELRYLWQTDPTIALCGCGRVICECDYWRNVLLQAGVRPDPDEFQAMQTAQQQVDRVRYIPMMLAGARAGRGYRRRHADYTAVVRRLYEAIHAQTGARIIIDASKDMSTLYLLATMTGVNLRILHMVRDGRAVAYSWTKEKLRADVIAEDSPMDRYSPPWSAADYLYRNVMTESARGMAAGYWRLRYDDMVADLPGTISQAAAFMGLPQADLSFLSRDQVEFARESHAIAGNPMRFETGTITVRLDNAWRQQLPRWDKMIVTALTWPLLVRYRFL